jgi:hypothetical protein
MAQMTATDDQGSQPMSVIAKIPRPSIMSNKNALKQHPEEDTEIVTDISAVSTRNIKRLKRYVFKSPSIAMTKRIPTAFPGCMKSAIEEYDHLHESMDMHREIAIKTNVKSQGHTQCDSTATQVVMSCGGSQRPISKVSWAAITRVAELHPTRKRNSGSHTR